MHNFVLIGDLKNRAWKAVIRSGREAGQTVDEITSWKGHEKGIKSPLTFMTQLLLNGRISYRKSVTSPKSFMTPNPLPTMDNTHSPHK